MAYVNLKALYLLKNNIRAIMHARGLRPADVARELKCDPSTIHKLIDPRRPKLNIQMEWLDQFHKVFGLEPYEMFLPAITPLTERRTDRNRRSGTDRRVGWAPVTMRDGPRTKDALPQRLVELVEIGEKLEGLYFDRMMVWARAQLLRQGLRLGPGRLPDLPPIAERPPEEAVKRKKKRGKD